MSAHVGATFVIKYGAVPMHCEVQHAAYAGCEGRRGQEEQVKAVCSFFKHVLPNLERTEVRETVTEDTASCLLLVRSAADVVLQRKIRSAAQGARTTVVLYRKISSAAQGARATLIPSAVTWYTPAKGVPIPRDLTTWGAGMMAKAEAEYLGRGGGRRCSDEGGGGEGEEEEEGSEGEGTEWSKETGEEEEEEEESEEGDVGDDQSEEGERVSEAMIEQLTASITASELRSVTFRERILAAAAWKSLENPLGLRLLQLTLIGSRIKYQGLGLSHKLMRVFQDVHVMGGYHALLVWAGVDAVPWFRRQGFTEDAILNSRYAKFMDAWEDSVLMSLTGPLAWPPQPDAGGEEREEYRSMKAVDQSIDRWRERKVQEYAEELSLIESMRQEIATLREQVLKQDNVIAYLSEENVQLRHQRDDAETLLAKVMREEVSNAPTPHTPAAAAPESPPSRSAAPAAPQRNITLVTTSQEYRQVIAEFTVSLKTEHGRVTPEAGGVRRVCTPSELRAFDSYIESQAHLAKGPITRMFLGLPSEQMEAVAQGVFDVSTLAHDPFNLGVFGKGVYLTPYASKALHYAGGGGGVLMVKVALGNTQTVISEDPDRDSAGDGFHSLIVPGRRLPHEPPIIPRAQLEQQRHCAEEYVVFDALQVLPMYSIGASLHNTVIAVKSPYGE